MHHGRVGAEEGGGAQVAVVLELAESEPRLAALLAEIEGVTPLSVQTRGARLLVAEAPAERQAVLERLSAVGLAVCGFSIERADLQDAYLAHVREAGSDAA